MCQLLVQVRGPCQYKISCRQFIHNLVDNRAVRHITGIHDDVGLPVNRIPLINQVFQCLAHIAAFEKWPVVAPSATPNEHIQICPKPNRYSRLHDLFTGLLIHEGATTCRHDSWLSLQQSCDHAHFPFTERCLTVDFEHVFDRAPCGPLHFIVGVDEWNIQPGGEPAPNRSFA